MSVWQPILTGLVLSLAFGTIHPFHAMTFRKHSTLNLCTLKFAGVLSPILLMSKQITEKLICLRLWHWD